MRLPIEKPNLCASIIPRKGVMDQVIVAVRRNYRDAVRLSAREEMLAGLAYDAITARLHCDTARFHHGSARAYAKTLELFIGEELSVTTDKEEAESKTVEHDLAPMRCMGRRYRSFASDGKHS